MRRRLAALIVAAAAIAGLAAGCGGSDEADGPAAVVPVDTPAYVEIAVQPEGEAADGAEAALAKITGSDDPGQEIVSQIEAAAKEDGTDFDFSGEIEPWLGERMGVFPSSLAGESEAVLVIETTDADQALDFVNSQEDATGEEREYQGTPYQLDADGDAYGIVDDFLVFGDEQGFEQSVDAADGDSLGSSSEFTDSVDSLPGDRLLTLFAVPKTFLEGIPDDEIDPQGREFLLQALDEAGDEPVTGDLTASAEAITFELSAGADAEVSTEESALISELPANAWLGVGLADIGGAVENALTSLESAGIPGVSADAIRQQLDAQSGIDLDSEVIGALGDAAFFLQGTSAKQLGGALVIESTDPAASAQLINKLQALVKQQARGQVKIAPLASAGGEQGFQLSDPGGDLAQPIQVVQRDDRIVVGYGAASVKQGLSAQSGAQSLSGSPAFGSAQEAIGDLGIDAFLDFAPVFRLAESEGAASDPDYRRAKPYLDALAFLAFGSGSDDDRAIARFIVGLE